MKNCIHIILKRKKNFIIIFLLNIIIINISQIKSKKALNHYDSNISLVVIGDGNRKIIFNDDIKPTQIFINGVNRNDCINTQCNLEGNKNNITLIFGEQIDSCYYMFEHLDILKEVDLTYFDNSKVTTMEGMFRNCTSLEKINFGNINTSLVQNMKSLFDRCSSLTSVDLSIFDFSNVKDMSVMFWGCSNLQKINFGNINTSSVVSMEYLFTCCSSLTSVNLSMLDTSNTEKLSFMFWGCNNLTYLDISNFNTQNVKKAEEMFGGCNSLIYLNLKNFTLNNDAVISTIFSGISSEIKFCIEDSFTNNKLFQYTNGYYSNCSDKCFESNIKIDIKNKECIESCNINGYEYEYNNICYNQCPKWTLLNNNICEDNKCNISEQNNSNCLNGTPEEYYFDKNDELYKKCFINCKYCFGPGNESYNNCIECKNNYGFYTNLLNITNCYEKCEHYFYFDELNEFHCTNDFNCPENYSKLIINENKCINNCSKDKIYHYEFENKCIQSCPSNTIYNESIKLCIKKDIKDERDEDIQNFREQVYQYNVTEKKEDIIDIKNGVTYQITTSDNQKNNTYKNISKIDLGDCEKILKDKYKIDETLPLIIVKIDYYPPDTLIPIVGYEIYHPLNKSKLNLLYCEDILIKLNIPTSIDENNLFKYDPNSGFYTDNCFSYTTENGTDIILNDRKQEFIDNNLSLCENNCNYTGYNKDNKQSLCDCYIKNKIDLISEILENPNKLSNNFDSNISSSDTFSSNIISIKCTKALFSKDGLKNNISSYILLIFIGHFLLSISLFLKCGYALLTNDIEKILKEKRANQKQFKLNIQETAIKKTKKSKNKKKSFKIKKKKNHPPKRINNYYIGNMKKNSYCKTSKSLKTKKENNSIKKRKIIYNNYELNSLDFKEALLLDKRGFCGYYSFLIKTKNIILFSFWPIKDYNSMIIKTCIFSLSFSIHYIINFAFFDDKILHKIYEIGGKYDFMLFFSKILISFGIAYIITIIIKLIFLSERNISKIRMQSTFNLASKYSYQAKKHLVIKYIIFFIFGLIFLVFFWMLLSAFGAVYQNTQIIIFQNALISFTISLIYPFFFSIIPSIFRITSLKSKSEYAYKFSKFLQIL